MPWTLLKMHRGGLKKSKMPFLRIVMSNVQSVNSKMPPAKLNGQNENLIEVQPKISDRSTFNRSMICWSLPSVTDCSQFSIRNKDEAVIPSLRENAA